jgi:SOS-response transcriptional repressor LexA
MMEMHSSDIRYDVKFGVANSTTDRRSVKRYNSSMKPTDMAKWVREALKHGNIGQAELSRRLTSYLKRPIDRAAVNKMVIVRETAKNKHRRVAGDELLAIAEITGYPAPANSEPNGLVSAPILSWVSAGRLAEVVSDEFAEFPTIEAAGLDPDGDWIALKVDGTSMDRISPPESIIFVNRKDKRLAPNACYVISDEQGDATYKRYRPDPVRFEPVTNAPGHETIFPDEEPIIVGRVRRTVLDL